MAVLPTVFGMSLVNLRKYKPRWKEQLLKTGTLIKVNYSLTVLFYFFLKNKKPSIAEILPVNETKSHEEFSSGWEYDVKL